MDSRAQEVMAQVASIGNADLRWKDGRAFSLAYYAGPEVQEVADRAYAMYGSANGLNADAFPSLKKFQADVVSTVNRWVHGDEVSAGFMTSGGTESILLAVKASAHAAFEKACYYFGLESRRVAVLPDWRADVDAMQQAIDENTVLLVGSAPQYPQGVVDPIVDIAALARQRNINCHVDACMGGVTLTFLEQLGESIPLWDFRVDGVTSISVDLHKYGYTSKGASVILHRDRKLRSYQTFVTDNWLGGFYGSSGVLGTKSGGPMAAAWAVMNYLGDDGYRQLTQSARSTTRQLADAIQTIDGLQLRANPDSTLLSFGAQGFDVFAVADELALHGWYVDRQAPPDSLHCTVNAVHHQVLDEFIVDLRHAVAKVQDAGSTGSVGAYGTIE